MRNLIIIAGLLLFSNTINAQGAGENHAQFVVLLNSPHTTADGNLVSAGYTQTYSSLDEEDPQGDLIITYENERMHEVSLIFVDDSQQKSVSFTFIEDHIIAALKKDAVADGFVFVTNETSEGADRYFYQKGNIEMELAISDDSYTYTLRRK